MGFANTPFNASYDYEKTGYNIWVKFNQDSSSDTDLTALASNVTLACTSVKPAGMTIGKFDISTNANVKFKEYAGEDLAETQDITLTCGFNLSDMQYIAAAIGKPQTIVLEFRGCANRKTARKITYKNAFIMSFEPGDMSANNFPTATLTISTGGDDHTSTGTSYPYGQVSNLTGS